MTAKSIEESTGKGSEETRTNGASKLIRLGSRFAIDVVLLTTAFLMWTTDMTVLFFHLIFFWLALGAFSWQFGAFAVRAGVWVTVASAEVLLTVLAGDTQPEELIELPLLTSMLVLIFIIARRRAEAQAQLLEHQAMHDALTELPNRDLFMERLGHAMTLSERREDSLVAVLHVDVDHFKTINDSLGHGFGDRLLVALAGRLQKCLRPGDTLARLGGDEFGILLEEISSINIAARVAERIREELRVSFNLEGYETFATACVGISASSQRLVRPEDLLKDAETATKRAKSKGTARYELFEEAKNVRVLERLKLENDLRLAIERDEFRVYYQPKVCLESGRIEEIEALVRWEHPERGLVFPAEFISLAEETGLIVPIGEWVLREACRQTREWQDRFESAPSLLVSVNFSAKQFLDPGLAEDVICTVQQTGLEASSLQVEITESVLMSDSELALEILQKLKEANVRSAIDDFGKGYSSLGYLRSFPVDTMKVDRSFVGKLGQTAEDTAVVRLIVDLAHTLGLKVTAEGIELAEQLEQLREMGCDLGQGFYFSKPLPGPEVAALLTKDSLFLDLEASQREER